MISREVLRGVRDCDLRSNGWFAKLTVWRFYGHARLIKNQLREDLSS